MPPDDLMEFGGNQLAGLCQQSGQVVVDEGVRGFCRHIVCVREALCGIPVIALARL